MASLIYDPYEWIHTLCQKVVRGEDQVFVVPKTNKEALTGLPFFRPVSAKLPKEQKRQKLAKRIQETTQNFPLSPSPLAFTVPSDARAISYDVLLPSPNLFCANLKVDTAMDPFAYKLAASDIINELGFSDTVEIESVHIPDGSMSFFNVGLRCIAGPDRPSHWILGSGALGCSTCTHESRRPKTLCHAQLCVLASMSENQQKAFLARSLRILPSLSILDGSSALTAIYSQLTSGGGGLVRHSDKEYGTPEVSRLADSLMTSHLPEDIDVTRDGELPSRLLYKEEYITEEEERQLIALMDEAESSTLKRRVLHYGYAFDYHAQQIDIDSKIPIPPQLEALARRLYVDGLVAEMPDQITLNEYQPGQGIGFHIDVHATFTSWIASISLGSTAVMEFRQLAPVGSHVPATQSTLQDKGELPPSGIPAFFEKPTVLDRKLCKLDRRSLAVFSDEVRYAWQHSIPSRKSDSFQGQIVPRDTRVSVTFRKVRDPRISECPCDYPYYCDQKNPETYLNLLPTRLAGKASDGAGKIVQTLNSP